MLSRTVFLRKVGQTKRLKGIEDSIQDGLVAFAQSLHDVDWISCGRSYRFDRDRRKLVSVYRSRWINHCVLHHATSNSPIRNAARLAIFEIKLYGSFYSMLYIVCVCVCVDIECDPRFRIYSRVTVTVET